jgi:ribulose-5-phosphate 4-epimerase/fuculose-1-phosphate aldolase
MLTSIGDVMRKAYERGWITIRDGNISLKRTGKETMYITPSGWRKTIIEPEHIVKVKITEDGLKIPAGEKPSGELHMHYLLQKDSKKTRAVVHLHPTATIAAMYRGFDLQKICSDFPELYRYTKIGPSVPVLPVTSIILGEETAKNLGLDPEGNLEYNIVGQMGHGVTAVAESPWSAFEHIERLEHICQIVLASGVSP